MSATHLAIDPDPAPAAGSVPPVPEPSEYLADRPDVRDAKPWSAFAHVARRLEEVVTELTSAADFAGGTVVDYGCAESPYLGLFRGATYVGVDLAGNPGATVTLRADGTVPLGDASADLVLSTQVLEHVADPELYLRECVRLLRPGGTLILTTHGIMYLHRDPTDYWRWTCDGLTRIVDRAGLEVVEVRGVLGLVGASLQLLQAGLGSAAPKILRRPIVLVFQVLIRLADRVTSERSRRENGLVLAVRAVKAPAL
jgi:SAM-dependent methyltransferase